MPKSTEIKDKNMTFTIDDYSDEILEEMAAQVKIGLLKCGETAEEYAKDIVPVDTGNLKNSITYKVEDNTMYLGSNVEYAAAVEFGIGQKAQPYLKPAIGDHLDEYKEIIKNNLEGK